MKEFIKFLYTWQILIGAALGPFLAIVLSAIGFWIKSVIERKKERKEFLRRIEISITRSLNDVYVVREQLKWFSQRIKNLKERIKAITDDKTICLDRINFPTIREIYRDADMLNSKIKSYYLHNKILWIDAAIKEINGTTLNFKNDFTDLIRQNETLIALMRNNLVPCIQRDAYMKNLETFAKMIDDYIPRGIQQAIEIMAQIKVYNDKIRKKYGRGYWFLWKCEGTKFKYFRNKTEQKKFARNLDSMERVDTIIKKDVEQAMQKAQERSKLLQNQE